MAVRSVMKIACVLFMISIVINTPKSEAAIGCGDVYFALTPCLNYLDSGGDVPYPCCNGISALNNAAKTTPDRQTACICLKQIATNAPPAALALAASIPKKCGISIPYKIDPSTDCSMVV